MSMHFCSLAKVKYFITEDVLKVIISKKKVYESNNMQSIGKNSKKKIADYLLFFHNTQSSTK